MAGDINSLNLLVSEFTVVSIMSYDKIESNICAPVVLEFIKYLMIKRKTVRQASNLSLSQILLTLLNICIQDMLEPLLIIYILS